MFLSSTFYLSIKTAFLNGSGNEDTRDGGTITKVKQFQQQGESYPYVSAQAFRKWIRTTVNHLTNDFSYYERITRGSPTKKELKQPEGLWVDPVTYIEDDLFGYSHPFVNQPDQEDKKHLKVTTTNRMSPFQTTALVSIPQTSEINTYDGWVNPGQNTSLPFNTEMMSGIFEGNATLDLNRIGVYRMYGDIIEIDPYYADYYEENDVLEDTGKEQFDEYTMVNLEDRRKRAVELYYDSLLNIYGAAKSTILATDLSPRIFITAQLKSANNLFHGIIKSNSSGQALFDRQLLISRLTKRAKTLASDVYLGYRSGTLPTTEEEKLRGLDGMEIVDTDFTIKVTSPGDAANQMISSVEVIE